MPRPPSDPLSQREAQIMDILWELGEATAEQVRGKLSDRPHDSSVRTILRVLCTKKLVRADTGARPTIYRPAVKRDTIQAKATRSLLQRFFQGSAEQLLLHLLEEEDLTPEQLAQLRKTHRRRTGGKK